MFEVLARDMVVHPETKESGHYLHHLKRKFITPIPQALKSYMAVMLFQEFLMILIFTEKPHENQNY